MKTRTVLGPLADRTRRRLLEQLTAGPAPVQAIGERLGVSASAVSQHLKVLQSVGLVTCRAEGRQRIYGIAPDAFDAVRDEAERLLRDPVSRGAAPPYDPLEALARQRASTWPQLDALNILISFRVERLVHAMHADMRRIAAMAGLTSGEMLALGAIGAIGPPYETSPTALRQSLWISLPGIGKRLDLLESRGLIERLPNPEDRRVQRVRLTGRGLAALEEVRFGTGNPTYVSLRSMPRDERLVLERLLRKWQQAVEGMREA